MKNIFINQSFLNEHQINTLNKINRSNKNKFNNLLKKIYSLTNKKKKWILSPIFSRDFIQSKFFADLNFLNLVDYYAKKKSLKFVYVDSYFLKKIINKKYPYILVKFNKKSFQNLFKNLFNIFLSFVKLILFSSFMFFERNKSRKKKLNKKNLILIETFFHQNLLLNNKFHERYHKDVYKKFSSKVKNNCYFFPINLSLFHIKRFIKITEREKVKYLHPLDFLELEDYIESIFLLPSLGGFKSKNIYYDSYDISNLVIYYKYISTFNLSSYLANLNFCFLKRIKENNFEIKIFIDWYENQIIDKGFCLGKNIFFPNSKLKGHMGFINDFRNIHYYTPSLLEKKLEALPDEILLISKKAYLKFFKKIKFMNYKIIPAIRNKNIFKVKSKINNFKNIKKNLLFILSANHEESRFINNIILDCSNNVNLQNYNFILKPHSNSKLPLDIIKNKNINVYKGNFYNALLNADLIITGGTTATVESLILNKKIILIGNKNEITLNPLIDYSKKEVKICYDSNSLIKNINILSKQRIKKFNVLNKKLINDYFTKMSPKSFKNFLN